jgi:hypothetical protein
MQKCVELEARLARLEHQHAAEIRRLNAEKSMIQTRFFERRYSEAEPDMASIVRGFQEQIFNMSAQMAANASAHSYTPDSLVVVEQFRNGAQLQQLPLGVVSRSDRTRR